MSSVTEFITYPSVYGLPGTLRHHWVPEVVPIGKDPLEPKVVHTSVILLVLRQYFDFGRTFFDSMKFVTDLDCLL